MNARMALGLLGIAVGFPLACQMDNPAYNGADVTDASGKNDGELSSNGEAVTSTGDGDPTTGDGDGEPTTGDGDGDPTTGDGDGDPTTGDGDGDPTTGDGDGDPNMEMCSIQDQSCANGEPCCLQLQCCAGNPIPLGQEFCSVECPISDRNLKFGFQSVDSQWVLDQVVELPISTWSYKDGKDGHARHIGPMAQDFHSAFGVGASDRLIFQIDADGVSFAAIQALDAKVETLEAENVRLRATLRELEERLAKLEKQ